MPLRQHHTASAFLDFSHFAEAMEESTEVVCICKAAKQMTTSGKNVDSSVQWFPNPALDTETRS